MTIILRPGEDLAALKARYDERRRTLEAMPPARLRELVAGWLPRDLNRSEIIKNVLLKEFPSR